MIGADVEVVGLERVQQRMHALTPLVRAKLRGRVQSLGLELLRKVQADYLSGRALHVQTGRLRRSVNERTTDGGATVSSSVGTNVAYGRVWELGFSGIEHVRAHVRKVAGSSVLAQVRAHDRRVNLKARPFLVPALADMRARIVSELSAATSEVARGV